MSTTTGLERYRLISTLGSGGMATVMLAEDSLLDRRVALKRLGMAADPRGISRLRREALVGASVSHPNLVSIYDVVTSDLGDVVIVMEYVQGETLRDVLRRDGRLDSPEALRILQGVAAALDAIHRRGIVHRDVKPANILLGPGGVVKLADLGIASAPDRTRITSAGAVLGTFSYMAPEQLEDTPSTPAIDVYALAAMAFEMLAGRKARPEANPMAVAHAIATQPPPDLRQAWPAAPQAAADVLKRGMSRDPHARPATAGELVRRLRAALEPRETAAMRTRSTKPPRMAAAALAPGVTRSRPSRVPPPRRVDADRPRPDTARPNPDARSRNPLRGKGRWAAPLGLLALAAAVIAAVLATDGSSPQSHARTHASRSHARRVARGTTSTRSGSSAGTVTTSTSTSSGGAPSTAGQPGANTAGTATAGQAGAGTAAAATAGQAGAGTAAAATAGQPGAASPVAAVKSFYSLAVAHRYADAWALADPAFRNQLGGFESFQSGQRGDRSITFDDSHVVSQSSNAATVAIRTTSSRTDGTKHCTGTVDLARGSSSWLLHQIHINCA